MCFLQLLFYKVCCTFFNVKCFLKRRESTQVQNLLHIKAKTFYDPQTPLIYSSTDDADTKTRTGRQQNGDTYTLEISFPAVKYVLD
jgi:hypothetical protein